MESPKGWKELVEFYGDPNIWVREDGTPHPSWESMMVTVPFPEKLPLGWDPTKFASRARVHRKIAEILAVTLQDLVAEGVWPLLQTYDGGYTWRQKRGSRKLSMHAFGAAIDFNAATNGLGNHDFDMPPQVVSVFRRNGWTWGGQWSVPDGMHFQFGRSY